MTDDVAADDAASREDFLAITRDLLAAFSGRHVLKLRLLSVPGFQQAYEIHGAGPRSGARELK
jgi:hypothetical protein